MTPDEFRKSAAPEGSPSLKAMWHEAQGDWDQAHRVVQDDPSAEAAWVHAYLHRKEGDATNAQYWYSRAGKEPHDGATDQEWTEVVETLLQG